ncbi:MAG: RNA 2',3'-cyclic phosphodiesterase [Candidatus Bathyarchaeota archaeon]|nr:MAG: RNA 2',3'-cyclic phosphodiesterase [Candidatus Bathyarchaeota archaeon]
MAQEKVRSFIAFDLDEPDILTKIGELQKELTQTGARIRVVPLENLHITMSFLGEIPISTMDKVATELLEVDFTRFKISIKRLGAFPSLRRINVIWIGIDEGRERLEEIFQRLRPRLRRVGVTKIGQRFSPHITIARVKSRRNIDQLSKTISSLQNVYLGEAMLNTLKLKKSVLTPTGPIYSTIIEKRSDQTEKRVDQY